MKFWDVPHLLQSLFRLLTDKWGMLMITNTPSKQRNPRWQRCVHPRGERATFTSSSRIFSWSSNNFIRKCITITRRAHLENSHIMRIVHTVQQTYSSLHVHNDYLGVFKYCSTIVDSIVRVTLIINVMNCKM